MPSVVAQRVIANPHQPQMEVKLIPASLSSIACCTRSLSAAGCFNLGPFPKANFSFSKSLIRFLQQEHMFTPSTPSLSPSMDIAYIPEIVNECYIQKLQPSRLLIHKHLYSLAEFQDLSTFVLWMDRFPYITVNSIKVSYQLQTACGHDSCFGGLQFMLHINVVERGINFFVGGEILTCKCLIKMKRVRERKSVRERERQEEGRLSIFSNTGRVSAYISIRLNLSWRWWSESLGLERGSWLWIGKCVGYQYTCAWLRL